MATATKKLDTTLTCTTNYIQQKGRQVKTRTEARIYCGDMLIASRNINGKASQVWCLNTFENAPETWTREAGYEFWASWNNRF